MLDWTPFGCCGGQDDDGNLDSIEKLDCTTNDHLRQWEISKSTLPVKVFMHTLTLLKGKMYLIGEWEGDF